MTHSRRWAPAAAAAVWCLAPLALAAQGQVVHLPERDRALAGTAPVAFAVGRAEGADHEMFADVAAVAFDARDNLYVLDRQSARIMVYDPAGRFLRQVGRKGQGPGELQVPLGMAVAPDGSVMVSDMAAQGFSAFGPDGAFQRSWRFDGWMPMFSAGYAWHPRGVLGTYNPRVTESGSFSRSLGTSLVLHPVGDGAPVRVFEIPQVTTIEQRAPNPTQRMVTVQGPPMFAPAASFGALPDGNVAMSFTTGYTVRIVDLEGTTLRYIQRPTRPRPVTEADRERARERQREARRTGSGMITITRGGGGAAPPVDRAAIERSLAEMRFADTMPAIRSLRVAATGTIWVERTSPTFYDPGPIDLLTPAGEYRGTVTGMAMPAAISRGGLAAFIERDDDDVPRVVVRRLPEGWR